MSRPLPSCGREGLPILGGNPFPGETDGWIHFSRGMARELVDVLTPSCSMSAKSPAFPRCVRIPRAAHRSPLRNIVPAQTPTRKMGKSGTVGAPARVYAADTWTPPTLPIQFARRISCICSKDRCTSQTSLGFPQQLAASLSLLQRKPDIRPARRGAHRRRSHFTFWRILFNTVEYLGRGGRSPSVEKPVNSWLAPAFAYRDSLRYLGSSVDGVP